MAPLRKCPRSTAALPLVVLVAVIAIAGAEEAYPSKYWGAIPIPAVFKDILDPPSKKPAPDLTEKTPPAPKPKPKPEPVPVSPDELVKSNTGGKTMNMTAVLAQFRVPVSSLPKIEPVAVKKKKKDEESTLVKGVTGKVLNMTQVLASYNLLPRPVTPPVDIANDPKKANEQPTRALVRGLMRDTPLHSDLQTMLAHAPRRVTGTTDQKIAAEWAAEQFRAAGIAVRLEPYELPRRWTSQDASGLFDSDVMHVEVSLVAKAFSAGTGPNGARGEMISAGYGSDEELEEIGPLMKDKWLVVDSMVIESPDALFMTFYNHTRIEKYAKEHGVVGVMYISNHPEGVLYRQPAAQAYENDMLLVVVERKDGKKILDAYHRSTSKAMFTASVSVEDRGPGVANNVVAEIPGLDGPTAEVVVLGAHLDGWDLGQGALDNACNCALVMDVARQIHEMVLRPRRTIRFVLFSGEEQLMIGSWGYVQLHAAELDKHVAMLNIDFGAGNITGFGTNGHSQMRTPVSDALDDLLDAAKMEGFPAGTFGSFSLDDEPEVGMDNYDFMISGIPTLTASQQPMDYIKRYHSNIDTIEAVDIPSVKRNAVVMGVVAVALANAEQIPARMTKPEVDNLVGKTSLGDQMSNLAPILFRDYQNGFRSYQAGTDEQRRMYDAKLGSAVSKARHEEEEMKLQAQLRQASQMEQQRIAVAEKLELQLLAHKPAMAGNACCGPKVGQGKAAGAACCGKNGKRMIAEPSEKLEPSTSVEDQGEEGMSVMPNNNAKTRAGLQFLGAELGKQQQKRKSESFPIDEATLAGGGAQQVRLENVMNDVAAAKVDPWSKLGSGHVMRGREVWDAIQKVKEEQAKQKREDEGPAHDDNDPGDGDGDLKWTGQQPDMINVRPTDEDGLPPADVDPKKNYEKDTEGNDMPEKQPARPNPGNLPGLTPGWDWPTKQPPRTHYKIMGNDGP